MGQYGQQLASIPRRFFRWTFKVALGYAVVTAAGAYVLHKAAPQKTTAAWRAFWAPAADQCAVPPSNRPAQQALERGPMDAPPGRVASAPKADAQAPGKVASGGKPEIVVYGRDACGLTSRMRKALTSEGVPFRYAIIDEDPVLREVSAKLSRIGHQGGIGLPVVAINGEVQIRPAVEAVVRAYHQN